MIFQKDEELSPFIREHPIFKNDHGVKRAAAGLTPDSDRFVYVLLARDPFVSDERFKLQAYAGRATNGRSSNRWATHCSVAKKLLLHFQRLREDTKPFNDGTAELCDTFLAYSFLEFGDHICDHLAVFVLLPASSDDELDTLESDFIKANKLATSVTGMNKHEK